MGRLSHRSLGSRGYVYDGTRFSNLQEMRWAVLFDLAGISRVYRPAFDGGQGWRPDFALPQMRSLVSVKHRSDPDRTLTHELDKASQACDLQGWRNVSFLDVEPREASFVGQDLEEDEVSVARVVRVGDFTEPSTGRYGGLYPIRPAEGFGFYAYGGYGVDLMGAMKCDGKCSVARLLELHEGTKLFDRLWAEASRLVDGARVGR